MGRNDPAVPIVGTHVCPVCGPGLIGPASMVVHCRCGRLCSVEVDDGTVEVSSEPGAT
jgi:hypothetical protein